MLSLKTIPGSGGEEHEREQESPKGGGGLLAGPDRKLDGCESSSQNHPGEKAESEWTVPEPAPAADVYFRSSQPVSEGDRKLNRISPATAAVTLKKLEKGGYIHRAADDRDNRCNQICLTEKGKRVVEYSILFFSQVQQRMFAGFTEEERTRLTGDLERSRQI